MIAMGSVVADVAQGAQPLPCGKHEQRTHRRVDVPANRDELLKRLADGEWLTSGEVSVVLEVHRRTIKNMLDDERLAWRWHRAGRIKEIDPASVRLYLDASSRVNRGRTQRIELPPIASPADDQDL